VKWFWVTFFYVTLPFWIFLNVFSFLNFFCFTVLQMSMLQLQDVSSKKCFEFE